MFIIRSILVSFGTGSDYAASMAIAVSLSIQKAP